MHFLAKFHSKYEKSLNISPILFLPLNELEAKLKVAIFLK